MTIGNHVSTTYQSGDVTGSITTTGSHTNGNPQVGDIVHVRGVLHDATSDLSGAIITYRWWQDAIGTGGTLRHTGTTMDLGTGTFGYGGLLAGHELFVTAHVSHFTNGILGAFVTDRLGGEVGIVAAANAAPVAVDDGATLAAGQVTVTGAALANDTDADGDTLTVVSMTGVPFATSTHLYGSYGGLTFHSNGDFTYDVTAPGSLYTGLAAGETQTDSFVYKVSDGHGGTDLATVTITVTGVNDAPTVVDEAVAPVLTSSGAMVYTGNLLANDSDPDGDTLVVTEVGHTGLSVAHTNQSEFGSYGSAQIFRDGHWFYSPGDYFHTGLYPALAAGATATDTLTVKVGDGHGATVTEQLVITVTGVNDGPTANNDTGSATEAGTAAGSNASGNVLTNDTDPDTGDTQAVSAISGGTVGSGTAGTYGTLTLNANGSYSYVVNDANATVDALNAGDSVTDTFTYTVSDTAGATSTATLTVTIHGANDAAVISGTEAASVTEAGAGTFGNTSAFGNLTDTDVDNNDNAFQTASSQASVSGYGTYSVTTGGAWNYNLDNSNATVNAVALGQTLTDTFHVLAEDGTSQTVTITINGANDAPTILGDIGTYTYEGSGTGPAVPLLLGAVDPEGDTLSVTGVTYDTGSGPSATPPTGFSLSGATVSIDRNNAAFDHYADGVDHVTTIAYTISDGHGGTVAQQAIVHITGQNDAPVGVDDAASATETGTVAGNGASGNVLANDTDVDDGDTKSVSAIAGGTVGSTQAGTYGSLTLHADGSYTYDVAEANAAVDALRTAADTLTDSFTYTVSDALGATGTATLTVTIHGANDAPLAVDDSGDATEAGTVAGSGASGNVLTNDTDVDNGDTKAVSGVTGGTLGTGLAGAYGTLTLHADGSYGYVVDDANATVNAMNAGATLTDTFTYTMQDTAGASDLGTITITVHGANDAAVFGGTLSGSVNEAGGVNNSHATGNFATGVFSVSDVDSVAQALTEGGSAAHGHYQVWGGSSHSWSYTLDNLDASVEALNLGDTLTDSFVIHAADGTAKTVDILIQGANDAPVGVDDAGSAVESGVGAGSGASGNVIANDLDVDHSHTLQAVGGVMVGSYGTMTLTASGHYSYALDDSNPTVDALALGETVTDSFTYTVVDEHGASDLASITITVTGANDGPTAFADTGSTGNLLANDTDVDASDTHEVVNVDGHEFTYATQWQTFQFVSNHWTTATTFGTGFYTTFYTVTNTHTSTYGTSEIFVNGAYGSLDVTIDGDFTYNVDELNAIVDALAFGETLVDTFTYTMTDNHGATSSSTLTVTVSGENDAPLAVDDFASAVEAGATNDGYYWFDNALANDTDVDDGHVLTVAGVDGTHAAVTNWEYGQHGWLYMFSNGDYYYYVDNDDAQVNALGPAGTLQDSFSYTISDEYGATSVGHIGITIHGQNDAPTGSVAITGSAYEGQTLTAVPALSDPEGIATAYSYQWQADGVNIGANSSTYVLGATDLGKTISVIVSYTDGSGSHESVTGSIASRPGVIETGSVGADHILGSSGDDLINGGTGKDRMEGFGGNDTYMVDNVRDVVTEQPGGGVDSVIASCNYLLLDNVENLTLTGSGNFYAKGNASDNDLIGNSGKNAIYGFGGQDTLTGGAGADTFWLSAADVNSGKIVTITDFSVAEGDKINLSAIDAREGKSGNQPFTWIGTDSFASHGSNWTGLLRFDEGSHMLIGSTNADGTHLVEIQLVGIDHLGTDPGGLYVKNIVL